MLAIHSPVDYKAHICPNEQPWAFICDWYIFDCRSDRVTLESTRYTGDRRREKSPNISHERTEYILVCCFHLLDVVFPRDSSSVSCIYTIDKNPYTSANTSLISPGVVHSFDNKYSLCLIQPFHLISFFNFYVLAKDIESQITFHNWHV